MEEDKRIDSIIITITETLHGLIISDGYTPGDDAAKAIKNVCNEIKERLPK